MQATLGFDFIEEIRLRTWARENYVPVDERDDSWHPIVLEEMHSKDVEIDQEAVVS
jgi:hypothetical protein